MWYKAIAVAGFVAASSLQAQQQFTVKKTHLELRPVTGVYIPQGLQRRDFKAARTSGFQIAFEVSSFARVLTSVSWTDGQARMGAMEHFPRTQMWQYDIGAEFSPVVVMSSKFSFRPSLGLGVGARDYLYSDKGMASRRYPAGYYAVGSELRRGPVGLRIEGRSYLSVFRTPLDGQFHYRDDVFATLGLVYHPY